jgi:WD40 repeat protein
MRHLPFLSSVSKFVFLILELGIVTAKLDGHTFPPRQVTFSSTGRYCLTASAHDAMVWDFDSNTQIHRLSLRRDVVVKQVLYSPCEYGDEVIRVCICYIYFMQALKGCKNLLMMNQ